LKQHKYWIWIVAGIVVLALFVGGWTWHEQPGFCTICHNMQPYFDGWQESSLLAFDHHRANVACLDCHPFDPVQSAHEVITFVTGKYETPLAQRQFDSDWCFRCHPAHSSYEQIIGLTEDYMTDNCQLVNPHAYQLDNTSLIVSNPHEIPEGVNGRVECYQCHKVHAESPKLQLCVECHHSAQLDKADFQPCSACHEGGAGSTGGGSQQMF